MSGELVVKGGPELHAALKGLEGDLEDMTALNNSVAADLARAVSSAAPRVSGTLAGSFHGKGSKDKAEVTSELDYAPVINNGWPAHNIEAQRFAESALEASAGDLEQKYDQGLAKACRKAET